MAGFVKDNLAQLEHIKKTQPSATHIYMRRNGEDGAVIDVPIKDHAITTIMRNPLWKIVASNETMDDEVAQLFR